MTAHEAKAREILEKIDRDRFRSDIHPAQARDEHIGAIANALAEATEREREACAKIAETAKTLKAWLPTNDDGSGEAEHTTIHGQAIATAIRGRNSTDE